MTPRALIKQMLSALYTAAEAYATMAPDVHAEDYDPKVHDDDECEDPDARLYCQVAKIDAAITAANAYLESNS